MDKISYATLTQVVLCLLPFYCDSRSLKENQKYDIMDVMDYVADVLKSEERHYITDDKENVIIKPQKQYNHKNEKSNRKYVKQNIKTRKERSIFPRKSRSRHLMLVFQQKNPWDQNTKSSHRNNEYQGTKPVFLKNNLVNDRGILTALKSLERAVITFPQAKQVEKEKLGLIENGAWSQETKSEYVEKEEVHKEEELSKTIEEDEEPEDGILSKFAEEDEEQEDITLGREVEEEEVDDEEEDDENEEDEEYENEDDKEEENENEDDEQEEDGNEEDEDEEHDTPIKTSEEDEEKENKSLDKNTERIEEQEDETLISEDTKEGKDKEDKTRSKTNVGYEKKTDDALDKNNNDDEDEDKETVNKSTKDYTNKAISKYLEGDKEQEVKTLSNDTKKVVDETYETLTKIFKEDKEHNNETRSNDNKVFEEQDDKILGKGRKGYDKIIKTFCIYTGGNVIEDKNCSTTLVLKSIVHKLKK